MFQARLARLGGMTTALVAIIALLVLADVVYAGVLIARNSSVHLAPTVAQASPKPGHGSTAKTGHPCNHGFYVSQAAHSKKGGGYVSGIAKSGLGKDGDCATPLPPAAPARPAGS